MPRTFKICSRINFQVHNAVLLVKVTMSYSGSTEFTPAVFLKSFPLITISPKPQPLVTTILLSATFLASTDSLHFLYVLIYLVCHLPSAVGFLFILAFPMLCSSPNLPWRKISVVIPFLGFVNYMRNYFSLSDYSSRLLP